MPSCSRLGERGVGAPHLADMGKAPTAIVHGLAQLVASVSNEVREEEGHHVFGAGQGEQAEQPADLTSEPATANQHEPIDELGVLVGQLHGHASAERVPDHCDRSDLEQREKVAQPTGERAEGVVAHRLRRFAVPDQVGRQNREVLRQAGHHVLPGARAPGHPVDQQQRRFPRIGLGQPVSDIMPMQDGMAKGYAHTRKIPLSNMQPIEL